ncbi:MAG: FAD-dependent oxidoreductase [Staphylothermus sp.]|nr:FAD-dependent oxidoreductase [Staphylothermus sp.]
MTDNVKSIYDVIVYGAGYAGLTAALELLKRKQRVIVIEADPGISHASYYPGIDNRKVRISKKYWSLISKIGVNIINEDEHGYWIDPLEYLVLIASEIYRNGGTILTDSAIEPIYKIIEDRIVVIGAAVKSLENETGSDRIYILSKGIIDASPNAYIVNNLIDRLKISIVIQGAGPQIP